MIINREVRNILVAIDNKKQTLAELKCYIRDVSKKPDNFLLNRVDRLVTEGYLEEKDGLYTLTPTGLKLLAEAWKLTFNKEI